MSSNVRMLALSTAVPPFVLKQGDVQARAEIIFKGKDIERMLPVFANTGIERRYSCVPMDWYEQPHGWIDRNELYIENAVALLEIVTQGCVAQAGIKRDQIDAIISVSTTGIATPSLDALLVERMGLRRDIKRLPIFGLGCAGGVIGLARAADMAAAMPGAKVLLLVVELCALTFRKDDFSKSNIVAAALFGDGAAGAILSTGGAGPRIGAGGEYTWPHSLDVMGWDIQEDGLKARFAQSIPSLVASDFRKIALEFLHRNDMRLEQFAGFACHPGGAKVLDALEEALGLPNGGLKESREILRDYGNMSAVTVLFVLERLKDRLNAQRTLASALGPGFTCAFQVLEGE
ncbi:MAG: type III polyketide synthase [Alphaproteobacteria bacterium]